MKDSSKSVERTFGTIAHDGLEPPFGTTLEALEAIADTAVSIAVEYRLATKAVSPDMHAAVAHRSVITTLQSAAYEIVTKMAYGRRAGLSRSTPFDAIEKYVYSLSLEMFRAFDARLGGEILAQGGLQTGSTTH